MARYVGSEDHIQYYALELKDYSHNLDTHESLSARILPDNFYCNGDTLEDDWPRFDENDPVNTQIHFLTDAVVSNLLFSGMESIGLLKTTHAIRLVRSGPKADYAFLLHDLYHLKPGRHYDNCFASWGSFFAAAKRGISVKISLNRTT